MPEQTRALIRPPKEEDARPIAELHVRSWQVAYRGLVPDRYLQALADNLQRRVDFVDKVIRTESCVLRVAERDGVVVGWSSFGVSRDEDAASATGELYSLYLDPEVWSSGVGRDLWLASRQALEADGYRLVTLWALDGNQRAERFYRAAGFNPEAHSSRTFEEGGTPLPLTRYQLRLAQP
jgi:ribosomal protein S18 acetylase RimI-like enzyme